MLWRRGAFWLGPEGGQYSIYFKGSDSFVYKNWQVPAVIDSIPYDVAQSQIKSRIYSKATPQIIAALFFNINIERSVSLLKQAGS